MAHVCVLTQRPVRRCAAAVDCNDDRVSNPVDQRLQTKDIYAAAEMLNSVGVAQEVLGHELPW